MIYSARNLIAFFLFCLITGLHAQRYEDLGILIWSDSLDLRWSDFKAEMYEDSTHWLYLDLEIRPTFRHQSAFGAQRYQCVVNQYQSVVGTDRRNHESLLYAQAHYDLCGLYADLLSARLARYHSIQGGAPVPQSYVIQSTIDQWHAEISRLATESSYGLKTGVVLGWQDKIDTARDTLPVISYVKSSFSLGLDIVLGSQRGLADYRNLIQNGFGGSLSIEGGYNRWVGALGLSGSGTPEVKRTFDLPDRFNEGTELSTLNLFLHGGYALISTPRWTWTPRIGIHYSKIFYPEDEPTSSSEWDFNYTLAQTLDFKLTGYEDSSDSIGSWSLRLGGYYYPFSSNDLKMNHLIIGIGVIGRLQGMILKPTVHTP